MDVVAQMDLCARLALRSVDQIGIAPGISSSFGWAFRFIVVFGGDKSDVLSYCIQYTCDFTGTFSAGEDGSSGLS
jgi:hypothetical protein